ncbi:hypothetical protein AJ88_06610 [Mesorhizobium amorphae CCBAU 01583]|nr:hypothetical protein AJ88_06610 [Mesorhizobium amorphae CCBAU 01583]
MTAEMMVIAEFSSIDGPKEPLPGPLRRGAAFRQADSVPSQRCMRNRARNVKILFGFCPAFGQKAQTAAQLERRLPFRSIEMTQRNKVADCNPGRCYAVSCPMRRAV